MCEHNIDNFRIGLVTCTSGSGGCDVWFEGSVELKCKVCEFKITKPFDYSA